MENKPASLLVPLGKAVDGIPPSWCGVQVASNSLASLLLHVDCFLVIRGKCATKYNTFLIESCSSPLIFNFLINSLGQS